jgi:hypothetical protein
LYATASFSLEWERYWRVRMTVRATRNMAPTDAPTPRPVFSPTLRPEDVVCSDEACKLVVGAVSGDVEVNVEVGGAADEVLDEEELSATKNPRLYCPQVPPVEL